MKTKILFLFMSIMMLFCLEAEAGTTEYRAYSYSTATIVNGRLSGWSPNKTCSRRVSIYSPTDKIFGSSCRIYIYNGDDHDTYYTSFSLKSCYDPYYDKNGNWVCMQPATGPTRSNSLVIKFMRLTNGNYQLYLLFSDGAYCYNLKKQN